MVSSRRGSDLWEAIIRDKRRSQKVLQFAGNDLEKIIRTLNDKIIGKGGGRNGGRNTKRKNK